MKNQTRNIVISGLMIALSILLTRIFSQDLLIGVVKASRLSVGFVPIMLAGIVAGPVYGAAVGMLADMIGFFFFPSGVYFPLITLTSALAGLLPALVFKVSWKAADWLKTLLAVVITQMLCSVLLQTWFLSMLFNTPFEVLFLGRLPVALLMIPVFFLLIHFILAGLKRARLIPHTLGG